MRPFCRQPGDPGFFQYNGATSSPSNVPHTHRNRSDDPYLIALATTDFSSPSLPPLSSSPSRPLLDRPHDLELPRAPDIGGNMSSFTAHRRSSRSSRAASGIVDLTKDELNPDSPTSRRQNPSASLPVPSIQHSQGTMPVPSASAATRKRRASASQGPSRPNKSRRPEDSSDPFDDQMNSDDDPFAAKNTDNKQKSIDLSNATEVPKELLAPTVDNRIKLGKFQCVICMDDVTALTVTHCGHLFCSECLHSALHIDSNKKICPVCRTKVDMKNTKSKNPKGFYHLELKLMTKTKQGKRPAG